ncbi:MAG: glycosyltransferase family 4 protein [Verrucomicrobiota bacterium]|nr:glycosyltransferase family 4 protein [Verrucomicrobiota bacterium]
MRVAFVVQRCGVEVNGGAEAHCLQMAQRMSQHWDTEVLTTCALDYMTWENSYPPGLEQAGGTAIRRFPVDQPRDVERFNRLSGELHARQAAATIEEQETWMREQGPVSTALVDYLAAQRDEYDAFIFFGYLYATTYFGLPVVEEKAFLAPLAHEEWTIYFSMWDRFFDRPQQLIFNTSFERDFLHRRFPALRLPGPVVGVGIDPPRTTNPDRFRARYGLHEPFLLYVGRVDESKGCRWLIENFIAARNANTIQTKLVLAGTEVMPIPFHDDVVHLGFIGEEEKWDAMAACDWLVMPSPHESLSMVLLEAWAAGRPAIVTAEADVLTGQCRRANAGLWYRDWAEFEVIWRSTDDETKKHLGEQGRHYVSENCSWKRVEEDYLRLLGTPPRTRT